MATRTARSLATEGVLGGAHGLATDGILASSGEIVIAPEDILPTTIPDDGGTEMSSEGASWPTDQGVYVSIDTGTEVVRCYSGVIGQEYLCTAVDGVLSWVSPPLPVGGPYDVLFESEDGTFTATGETTVVHRSYTTNLYSLRSAHPPPRDVGAYTLADEED